MQIVIAWKDQAIVSVRDRGADLGRRPEVTMGAVGKSVLWLHEGTEDDVRKAEAYALTMADHPDAKVYTFPTTVKDARKRAETMILSA